MQKPPCDDWYKAADFALATPLSLPHLIDEAIRTGLIGLDSESRPRPGIAYSGLDTRPFDGLYEDVHARLAGICVATTPLRGFYAPLQHDRDNIPLDIALREFRRLGAAILDGRVVACFWHATFDQALLAHILGIKRWPQGSFIDGEVLDRFLRPHSPTHELKRAIASTLGRKMLEFSAPRTEVWVTELDHDHSLFAPRPNMGMDFGARPPQEVVAYAVGDAACTLAYVHAVRNKNLREDTQDLVRVEHDFIAVVRALHRSQIGYDRKHALCLADKYMAVRKEASAALQERGLDKPSSSQQAAAWLARYGWHGEHTDKKALARIPHDQVELRSVVEILQRFRRADKYISSYICPLINADHPFQLQGSYSASGAKSGRMSAGPQKSRKRKDEQYVFATYLPHGQPKQAEFRRLFIARPGRLLLKADWISQEYRAASVLAGAASWVRTFNLPTLEQQDVHAATGRQLFSDYDIVSQERRDEYRKVAKIFNFSVMYGSGPDNIAAQLGCDMDRALHLLERFYSAEPALRAFQDRCQAEAKRFGRVYSYFGRPISVRASDKVTDDEEGTEVHASTNYRIQSTCGDLLKIAMTDFFQREAAALEIFGGDDSVRLVNLVHDEAVVEVVEDQVERVSTVLRDCMESAPPSSWPVRFPVELSVGATWAG